MLLHCMHTQSLARWRSAAPRRASGVPLRPAAVARCHSSASHSSKPSAVHIEPQPASSIQPQMWMTLLSMTLTSAGPAMAASEFVPAYDPKSYWVSLGLFTMTLPGLWSLIKRAPKSKIVRKTFEVDGPAKSTALTLDDRARQIFRYFKKYNYSLKETGDVITFEGVYAADKSQAAALVLYTFLSLGSTALVLSIAVPQIGNWWYLMTLISPTAGAYYWSVGTRTEQMRVKMVTSDDEATTDIVVEGDSEEIERFWQELGLLEKGKVYVKGLLG